MAEGGQTSGFDADSFYQQSLQDSGYSLGTNDCLDKCWVDFRRCLDNPLNGNPQACLAQLTACQRSCGTQQQDASETTGDTGTTEAKEAEADGAQDSGGNADSDQTSGDSGSQGTDGSNQIQVTLITSYGQAVRYWIQDKATDYNNETAPGQGKTLVDGDAHGPGERITVTCTETANGASVCYKRESYPYPPGGGETPWTSALISAGGEHDMIL
ncbi:MAG: hypothetical protein JOZ05_16365 [Acetobacteraceae bacterium]|nr:hypothetical protein [Acetobacteraceae bacterium]